MTGRLFPYRAFQAALLVGFCIGLAGCTRAIGDACETNQECPTGTGSSCDVTVPDGYCTVQGCDIDSCPENSVCVQFDRESAFCMQFCTISADCRGSQVCRRDIGSAPFCFIADAGPSSETAN